MPEALSFGEAVAGGFFAGVVLSGLAALLGRVLLDTTRVR